MQNLLLYRCLIAQLGLYSKTNFKRTINPHFFLRLLSSVEFSHKVIFHYLDGKVNAEAAALEWAWQERAWLLYQAFWK